MAATGSGIEGGTGADTGEREPLVCWCFTHEYPALIYRDGSVSCMFWLIVESRGDCTVGTVPQDRLARKVHLRATHSGSQGGSDATT